jgi:hypothetical protein
VTVDVELGEDAFQTGRRQVVADLDGEAEAAQQAADGRFAAAELAWLQRLPAGQVAVLHANNRLRVVALAIVDEHVGAGRMETILAEGGVLTEFVVLRNRRYYRWLTNLEPPASASLAWVVSAGDGFRVQTVSGCPAVVPNIRSVLPGEPQQAELGRSMNVCALRLTGHLARESI